MELIPSRVAALRVFVGLTSQLRVPRADGLASRSGRPRVITGSSGGDCI
ncbi:hypothetical protein OOK55_45910 [Streptomyces sp. NBC_01719]|nr:hypothetical protein [Streptomyces sp. NBC_01719]